jgi:hypothetical protein
MATGFFVFAAPLDNRVSPASILSLWPLRYGGAYLLAWLTARHVDGAWPRRAVVLFAIAGLVAINNVEFGAAAFAATLAALACGSAPRSLRDAARLLGSVVGGLAAAVLIVSLLTLAHSGQLPRFSLLVEFPRLYGRGGWVLLPMPTIGLQLVVFVTFVAAGVVAVVRALNGEERLLTALLAWSAVFGLLAGSYYVGRSDELNLIAMLSAWAFSLALLLVAVVRSVAASRRWPSLPELAVLFGFGLAVCSLAQMPTPWSQVARLRHGTPVPVYKRPGVERFVAAETQPGADVALLLPMGHRIAYDLGRTNVSPYSGVEAMVTRQQVRATIELLRRDRVHRVFLGIRDTTPGDILPEVLAAFGRAGFARRAQWSDVVELSDERRAASSRAP